LAEARVRQPQDQHDDERHADQHIDRPAVGKEPRQQDRVETGGHMDQLALHLRADLQLRAARRTKAIRPSKHPDRCQRQRDLDPGLTRTSSTTKSE
jgi:hypothetical protein